MRKGFFLRIGLFLSALALVGVAVLFLPESVAAKKASTPEVVNVQASKESITPLPAQQPSNAPPKAAQESPRSVSDAIGILQTVASLMESTLAVAGIIIGLIALIVTIATALGLFEILKAKKAREILENHAKVMEQQIKAVGEMAREAKRQASEATKIIDLAKQKYKEVEEFRESILITSMTEKPSEEVKKKLDEFARKIEMLETLGVSLKPEDHFKRGLDLYYKEEYEGALMAFEKAIELKPDYADAWTGKGAALANLGRDDEALKAYGKAIELKPDDALAWNNKGATLIDLGRDDEALKAYNKAIELKPDFTEAWTGKGIALRKLGRHDEALKASDKAIELKPDNANAWFNLAYTYSLKGDKENALKHLAKAIELDKKFKEKAKTDEDFKGLWDNADFKKLVE